MTRLLRAALAATCIIVVLPCQLLADAVSLSAAKDNTLYQTMDGSLSNGAGLHFFAGQTALGELRRGVAQFNLTGEIPAGSIVTGVTLRLFMSRTQPSAGGPATVALHQLSSDWGEGTSAAPGEEGQGAVAAAGDATWLHTRFSTNLWTNPGGDFTAAAAAAVVVDDIGHYTWSSQGMINIVQGWVNNPGSNFGWIVIGDESSIFSAKRFDTRESGVSLNQPTMTVTFNRPLPVEETTWGGIKALYKN